MKLSISLSLLSLGIFTGAAAAGCAPSCPDESLSVRTPYGTYVGTIEPKFENTRIFKAIPFAKPPTSSLRWLPPQQLPHSNATHYATTYPPSCPQFFSSHPSLWNQYIPIGNQINNGDQNHTSGLVGENTSEDCLYLAVFTPKNATVNSKLPVMFFMTGGGFQTGGVYIPQQIPTDWVDRTQSHIVVTINYRLNIFGFPNAKGLEEQNLGILDQRAALEWVHANIASFGGDPNRIVQWGHSAGSESVDIHAYAYYKDPLVYGYFMQSGVAPNSISKPRDQSNFTFVAKHFGCDFACDGYAELDCMRRVPFPWIENFIGQYQDNGTTPALTFNTVVDEKIFFSNYPARARAGLLSRKPAIIGNAANEESSLYPWPVNNLTAGPYEPAVYALDLSVWMCPTLNATSLRNALNIPVYRYQTAGRFPNLNPLAWLGSYHASDLPTFFGTYDIDMGLGNYTNFEAETSRTQQDYIYSFLQDPYNGPEKIGWYPLNASQPEVGEVIRFGANGKAAQAVPAVEIDGPCRGIGTYNMFP